MAISRRDFIKLIGTGTGCLLFEEQLRAFVGLSKVAEKTFGEKEKWVYSICEYCAWRCGTKVKVVDNVVKKIEGNPEHPFNYGKICAKGNAAIKQAYDPDRLKYPLIRAGSRGENKWKKASWDEALDYSAKKLLEIKKKYGPEAVLFTYSHMLSSELYHNLAYGFGSPNLITNLSLCAISRIIAEKVTYGTPLFLHPGYDIKNCRYIILLGHNILESLENIHTQWLIEALSNGGEMVYVDPRFTVTASKAKRWLPIKPGTDLALLLAMTNVIVNEGLYQKQFVEENTFGFGNLKNHIQPYTPEWAEKECEIASRVIREVAREFAQASPSALVHPGWRTTWHKNDLQIRRAIHILNVLAGNWGVPGGIFLKKKIELGIPKDHPHMPSIPRIDEVSKYMWTPEEGLLQNARDNAYFEKPYPIKGWVNIRMNPLLNMPDTNRTIEVFKRLDFALTIDVLLSETALFSDVVLPECTYLERTDPVQVSEPYPSPFVALRQQAIKPMFDSKPSWWIFKQLAERLGIGEYFKYRDVTDIINFQVKPLGIDINYLKEHGVFKPETGFSPYHRGEKLKFDTPSGKIELYSNILEKKGYDPLPVYKANPQPPPGRFRLITSRHAVHSYSMTQNNQWLHEIYPENELWMNPEPAKAKGLRDSEYVWVKSKVGRTKIKLKITDRIRPDCVYMVMGFGHFSPGLKLAYNKGGSQAAVLESAKAEITGGSAFHDTFVEVVKA